MKFRGRGYSQDVADDADGPHVSGVADGLEPYHLWRHKLRSSKKHLRTLAVSFSGQAIRGLGRAYLKLSHGLELSSEAKVDDLDAVSRLGHAQYVFRL